LENSILFFQTEGEKAYEALYHNSAGTPAIRFSLQRIRPGVVEGKHPGDRNMASGQIY
jgi:hypothetical protein